jgi:hypothetical protein
VLSTYPLLGDGLLPMALATGPSPQSTSRHCSVNGGSPGMVLRSLGGWTAVHAAPQPPQPQRYRPRSLNAAVAVCREHGRVDGVRGWRGRLLAWPLARPSSENETERQQVRLLPPLTHTLSFIPGVSRASGANPPGGVGVSACGTHRRTRFWWAPPGRHTTCVCQPGGVCPGLADIASIAAPHSRCLLDPLRSVPLAHDHSRLDR